MKTPETEKITSIILIGLLCTQVIFQVILFFRLSEIDQNVKTLYQMLQPNNPISSTIINIPIEPDWPLHGSTQAEVTIIEFSDFACSVCKDMVPVLENIVNKYFFVC